MKMINFYSFCKINVSNNLNHGYMMSIVVYVVVPILSLFNAKSFTSKFGQTNPVHKLDELN
jgi:hypothetical protein